MTVLNPSTQLVPTQLAAVVVSDATRFEPSLVTVYGAGNITIVDAAGVQTTLTGVPAGATLPCMCTGVLATGATATNIVRAF